MTKSPNDAFLRTNPCR